MVRYRARMAEAAPVWRQQFDAVERQVSPRLEGLVRSEGFAVAVGLAARVQRTVEDQLSRTSKRVLHRLNLPAGSDVTRLLKEIGQLRLQVRALQSQLDELRPADVGAPKRTTKRATKRPAKRPATR